MLDVIDLDCIYKSIDIRAILAKPSDRPHSDWICAFLEIEIALEKDLNISILFYAGYEDW